MKVFVVMDEGLSAIQFQNNRQKDRCVRKNDYTIMTNPKLMKTDFLRNNSGKNQHITTFKLHI